jgi:hypothetical protein
MDNLLVVVDLVLLEDLLMERVLVQVLFDIIEETVVTVIVPPHRLGPCWVALIHVVAIACVLWQEGG